MQKHLLIVGGATSYTPIAKKAGHKISLLLPAKKLANRKDLGLYDRIITIPEKGTLEEWLGSAVLINQFDRIDAVGAFNEEAEFYAVAIAEKLGLPCSSRQLVELTHDKNAMRQVLKQHGLDDTASCVITEDLVCGVEGFAEQYGYPVIIKPLNARGSTGISIVRNKDECAEGVAWFKKHAGNYSMLVEQFLEGTEWSVEAFSENGQHKIICITQKFKDSEHFVETGHCLPAFIPVEDEISIKEYVNKILTALGFTNGPSHTEIMLTRKGPRIIETHTRLAGDRITDLIRHVSGIDPDTLWVHQVMGQSIFSDIPVLNATGNKFAAIHYSSVNTSGVLKQIVGVDDARANQGVVEVDTLYHEGEELTGAFDSFSRGTSIIAVGESAEEAVKNARNAADKIRFIISCKS
ncbi:ATP-grasp domain-containing protein [Enterobacter sp. AD2-3]|uniref:ATP-grasp domain-containing protein n=1 Tax=Enterobacter sp. AD2-3 TaxID=2547834 RepID=UPI001304925C|nr:ATP-grasp domain-containing protein [Enterobacter sp. AD2-3]